MDGLFRRNALRKRIGKVVGGLTLHDVDELIRELADIKAARVSLRVNSPGGDVFDGIAIFNAIRRHKAYFTAYIDGIGASAASWIPLAADKVVMSPHSQLFIHDASGFAWGNAADMRKLADELDRLSDEIASMYAARAGGDVAEWRDRMRAETWFSDSEAVAAGLADEIDGQDPEEAASNALDGFDVLAAVKAGVAGVTRNENVLPEADWAGAMKAGTARAYGGQ